MKELACEEEKYYWGATESMYRPTLPGKCIPELTKEAPSGLIYGVILSRVQAINFAGPGILVW